MSGAFDLSKVRNRLVGTIELLPGEIQDHPLQAWDHPGTQAAALVGALQEVGVVDRLLVYKSARAHGAWVTPDGHLRKSLDPDFPWPCDIVDLTDEEADYILATKDPIGAMKRTNAESLDALLSAVSSGNPAIQEMFADMAQKAGLYLEPSAHPDAPESFDQFDENIATSHECPKCGFRWSGSGGDVKPETA